MHHEKVPDLKKICESSQEKRVIHSELLMGSSSYLDIAHAGEIYRLRVTKFGKLILTK